MDPTTRTATPDDASAIERLSPRFVAFATERGAVELIRAVRPRS